MKYIYLQRYTDGSTSYFYVGKHSWPGQGIDPDYHGSGSRLASYTWVSQIMLEDCSSLPLAEYNAREVYWITYYAQLLGVVPFSTWDDDFKRDFYKYCRPDGRLLNCHANKVPDRSSGFWCFDDSAPMHFPDMTVPLGCNTNQVAVAWDKLGRPEQFIFHGHWIHRPGASMDSDLKCWDSMDSADYKLKHDRAARACSSDLEWKRKQEEGNKKRYEHTEWLDKMSATKRSKRPRYRLTDGFEGDYEEIASHINYTGKQLKLVSAMLRGAEPIYYKYEALRGAKRL